MKKLLFILLILTACTKEQPEPLQPRMAQLLVEGDGAYQITYGTSNLVTLKGTDKWKATMNVIPGDTIKFSVKTSETPATLYLSVEIEEGILYCKSLYIDPESSGSMNHVVNP